MPSIDIPYSEPIRATALALVQNLVAGRLPVPCIQPLRTMYLYHVIDPDDLGNLPERCVVSGDQLSGSTRLPVPYILDLLLCHTLVAESWRINNLSPAGSVRATSPTRRSTNAFNQGVIGCVIELLLLMGLPAEGEPRVGETRMSLLHMLASGGCQPDRWDDRPVPLEAPLQWRLIHLCVGCGADVERPDENHEAGPLGWACWFGCVDGATAMLDVGADPSAEDAYGSTPRTNAFGRHGLDLDDKLRQEHERERRAWLLPNPKGERDEICRNRMRLRRAHAGWAEEEARGAAAIGARWSTMACEAVTTGEQILPGPALQVIANVLMREYFTLWPPVTVPMVCEG